MQFVFLVIKNKGTLSIPGIDLQKEPTLLSVFICTLLTRKKTPSISFFLGILNLPFIFKIDSLFFCFS